MSNFKKKQNVRQELNMKKIGNLVHAEGQLPSRLTGLLPDFTSSSRPDATNLPDGVIILNTTTNNINYTKDGAWVELGS